MKKKEQEEPEFVMRSRIDRDLDSRLGKEAKRLRTTKSAVARMAVGFYLDQADSKSR